MNEIKHVGILGMKWGVRRGRNVSRRFDKKKSTKAGATMQKKHIN